MTDNITIGLPRMRVESGERRDFLPNLVADLDKHGAQVLLEYGYGAGLGLKENDYLKAAPGARFASHDKVYKQQFVLVLRCPAKEDLKLLEPGSCIISMLRVELLNSLKVEGISLDSLQDDSGQRLVENLRSVAWNGLEVGFQVLRRTYPAPGMENPNRPPINSTVLGVGAVGVHAVQAASRYGDPELWQILAQRKIPGVQVTAIEYDLTGHEGFMRDVLARTDILVDATHRIDTSKPVISNKWIGWMPEHAVIVDLSVDPYLCHTEPIVVKGIEGIPHGNLDQYVFLPSDPAFDRIPACATTENRRHTVSCYSWPGIHPKSCMKVYGEQIWPILSTIIEQAGVRNIQPQGDFYQRAIHRALLSQWTNQ